MLSKLLEDLGKRLLEALAKRPWGGTLLAVAGVIAASFVLLQYLRSTPSAMQTLRDPVFLAVAALSVVAGAAIAMSRSQLGRAAGLALIVLAAAAAGAGGWFLSRDGTPVFRIDLVLDDSAALDPVLLDRLLAAVQQPHIRITLLQRRLLAPQDGDVLLFGRAADEAAGKLRDASLATHTVLVTARRLANERWSNLFYALRGNFAVVSIRGVADPAVAADQPLALRYLASMVPLAALHADAGARGVDFLPDRSDVTEHGCLHDFSADRRLLIAKLRREPQLCAAEVEGMTRAFGPVITAEYRAILQQSAQSP
jgi:hypothetical protein